MASFNKYNTFVDEVSKASHNLQTAVYKIALTNAAPNPASDATWNTTTYPPPAATSGYPLGGNTPTVASATTTGGVFKLVLNDTQFAAVGGSIGPFRYMILYNSSAGNKLVGFYDYGSNITLADTETFTVDFDPTAGALTLT